MAQGRVLRSPNDEDLSNMNKITLHCPKCGKSQENDRQPYDPPKATKVHIECPECNGGDFGEPHYFDADGNDIEAFEDTSA